MLNLKSVFLSSCVVLVSSGASIAADLMPPPPPAPIYDDMSDVSGLYVRGDVGAGISRSYSDKWGNAADDWGSDAALAYGAGVGYRYDDNWRGDITFDGAGTYKYEPCKCTDGSIKMYTVSGNVYYDMPFDFFAKPYIGAGVGYGWAKHRINDSKKTHDGLALSGMAGFTMELDPAVLLDTGYKFRNISVKGQDYQDHLFRTGLRYLF